MNPIVSHLLVLLAGLAIGAFFAVTLKASHDHRRAEAEEQEAVDGFRRVEAQMPELIAEMRADLAAPETRRFREFLLMEGGPEPEANDPTLVYSSARHADLAGKLVILLQHRYLVDISSENTPRFRMTEEFVRLLLLNKIPLRYGK